jgi:Na+-driven multidrug efflux pump
MGAALATILAQGVSALLVLTVLGRLPGDIALRPSGIRLESRLIRRILVIGVPAGLQFVTFDLANLLIQSGINSFGSDMVAAFVAYAKADALSWMISGAFGVAITTFVGQNFGAQKYDRIRKSVWICLGMSVGTILTVTTAIVVFRRQILGIFTADPAVLQLGAYTMLWTVPFNCVLTPMEVFGGAMRGVGNSLLPTSITSVCICLFRVVWLLTVVSRWNVLEALLLCYPVSWVLTATVFSITYLRGNWLNKRMEAAG